MPPDMKPPNRVDARPEDVVIRPYREEDEAEWMRVHAIILSLSHAWNYTIQDRPTYPKHASTCLVAEVHGRIAGLMDVQYDNEPGEICFLKDSRGGYVLEFGRLPEYGSIQIGEKLTEAAKHDARAKGIHRLEYWTQERRAQRYYLRQGMKEIGRHYRFRMKPPPDVSESLRLACIGAEYIYAACLPEEWPLIKTKYDIITDPPLEPHLCIGYEVRF